MRGAVVGVCAGAARSRTTILFESECSGKAVAKPMPDEPPVMRIVLFVRLGRLALSIVKVFVDAVLNRVPTPPCSTLDVKATTRKG